MVIGDDVFFASVAQLGTWLRERRLSVVELTEACLSRLERLGPDLGALVTLTRERAMGEAHKANQELLGGHDRGPLHGIPYGLKDLIATKGIPTTWGAQPYRDQVFDYDAAVVDRLRDAGAILVAKLAMVELAGGMGYNNPDASFTGPGRCPWNPDYWSGGSSSGPGAAVSAGLVPFAIGSETSGSILTPAAFSGISGLRPTYGLVPRHGAMALCWSLDKLGPMTRTAEDCGLVLSVISGPDPRDLSSVGRYLGAPKARTARRFRLAVPRDALARTDSAGAESFRQSISTLREFCDVEENVAFPDFPWGPAVGAIVRGEGGAAFRELIESGRVAQLQDRACRTGGYAMLTTTAADYLQAMRLRVPMRAAYDELLSRYDAIVAPTRTGVAPPIGYDFDKPPDPKPDPPEGAPQAPALIPAGNLVGAPALAVPNGWGRYGLPTSLQFLGRAGSEATLIALGERYQERTDFHRRRPAVERVRPINSAGTPGPAARRAAAGFDSIYERL